MKISFRNSNYNFNFNIFENDVSYIIDLKITFNLQITILKNFFYTVIQVLLTMEKIFPLLTIKLLCNWQEIQFYFGTQALGKKNIYGLKKMDIAE